MTNKVTPVSSVRLSEKDLKEVSVEPINKRKKEMTKEQKMFEDYCDENGIDYEDLTQLQMEDLNNMFQAYVAGRRTALKELQKQAYLDGFECGYNEAREEDGH